MSPTIKDYYNRRTFLLEKLGGVCVKCGVRDNLQFDHKNPRLKSFDISKKWSISLEKLIPELMKCQILCKSCHEKKTKEEDGLNATHGKFSMYRHHKCRCSLCKLANREQIRKWRQKKKNSPFV